MYHSEVLERLSLEQPFALDVVLEDFLAVIREAYGDGALFIKVMWHPEQHPHYSVKDGIIYTIDAVGNTFVPVPGALSKGRGLPRS